MYQHHITLVKSPLGAAAQDMQQQEKPAPMARASTLGGSLCPGRPEGSETPVKYNGSIAGWKNSSSFDIIEPTERATASNPL